MIKKERGYDAKMLLRYNEITRFYYDKQGLMYKYSSYNKFYRQGKELYEYDILERDQRGNPKRVLLRKNGRPYEYHEIAINYE